MAVHVEILTGTRQASPTATLMLNALVVAAREDGHHVTTPAGYEGKGDVLVLYGYGAPDRAVARDAHVASGRKAVLWDLGYFQRKKIVGHLRVSIDRDHPWHLLDHAPADGSRWDALGVKLRNTHRPDGHILLIGLGKKSRHYLRESSWETRKLRDIKSRYPGRRIVYRPKPGSVDFPRLPVDTDMATPIERLLDGASLVVCRHSNVAIDGIVAGIPFEAEDGAAMWMLGKPFDEATRLDFLRKLAWFQWKVDEASQAWQFVKGLL